MITLFRNFAKSKWAVGLLVLMALALLVTGGTQTDVLASLTPRHVIDAGDRSVNQQQFRAEFERVRANLQEQAGRPVTFDDMVAENIHTQYLESQTRRLGFLAWTWNAGIRPGKELILKQIREIPAFFNQVTGQFDQQLYQQALAAQNITPDQLEQDFRDQFAVNHFGAAVFAGARVPRIYGALLAGQALESRDGRWFTVTQAMAGQAPAPTEAQLTSFLSENADRLRSPEFRIASIVLFSPAAGELAPITEERIRERFEFRQQTLSEPEKRSFVTLTAPDKAAADRIAAALRAGQAPAEAGRAANVQPAPYVDSPQSAVGDQAVAAAVFALGLNQVSEPIQGRVGFTVAQVTAITPGSAASLDSAREAIVAELRAEDARGSTYEKVEAFEKQRQDGKSLADAAQAVNARIVQLPPFTQDGRLPDGQPLNAPPLIFQTAYGLTKGGESDVVDAGNGEYFAVRLDDVREAAMPSLDEVRAPLAEQWTLRENARLLSAKAEELAGRVRNGEDIAAVASSAGATLTTRAGAQRNQQTQAELGQGVLQGLFGQAKGQVFSQQQSASSFIVGRVDEIHAAAPAEAAPLVEQVRPRLSQELANAMVEQGFTAGSARVRSRNDPAQALAALGVTAPAAPATPAPAPAPAPAKK